MESWTDKHHAAIDRAIEALQKCKADFCEGREDSYKANWLTAKREVRAAERIADDLDRNQP